MFVSKGMLMTKTKNLFKGMDFTFKLHNEVTCYQKVGCSGFIQNNTNGKIVYINTEPLNGKIMYRAAKSLTDYTGGPNQWCYEYELKSKVLAILI